MKVKKTGRVETQEGGEGKVEDRVPKREKRIYKELEVLCLCGLDKLHSIEKSHAKKKKKNPQYPGYFTSKFQLPQIFQNYIQRPTMYLVLNFHLFPSLCLMLK